MNDDADPYPVSSTGEADDPSPHATIPPTTAIPQQRKPADDAAPTLEPPAPEPPRRRRGRRALVAVVTLLVLGATAGYAYASRTMPHQSLLDAAPAAAAIAAPPLTPYNLAEKTLDDQAAALLRHDHAGWMAAVDPAQPALRQHFEQLYASLQALHVSHFEYRTAPGSRITGPVEVTAEAAFCLSAVDCPGYSWGDDDSHGPPHIAEKLLLKPVRGHYVITKLSKAEYPSDLQPYPWETDPLIFKQGKRVTVAAPRSLAGKLATVLAVADKAALTDDRFAVVMKNPQQRYRIYLADAKAWKKWYGGTNAKYAVAYTIPTGSAGSDVVLQMSEIRRADLKVIVQHEMAHVATLSNLTDAADRDTWLKEGVADYIGWLPQHTRQDWDFPAARDALQGDHAPKSIIEAPLKPDASDRAANRFYGLAHFAVECMVTTYGEGRAMNFVRLRLREDDDLDSAARLAFGTSFAAVDKGCVRWMTEHS